MCGRNNLNLPFGAVQVGFTYGGFGGLLFLGTMAARMGFYRIVLVIRLYIASATNCSNVSAASLFGAYS